MRTTTEQKFNSTAAVTAHLPAVYEANNDYNVLFRNIGRGTLIKHPNGGELIDGASTLSLGTDQWRSIRSNGTGWKTISRWVPANSGGLTLVERIVASNNANVKFTGIDDSHESYFVEIQAAKPASNDVSMIFEFGTGDPTITWRTTGYAQADTHCKVILWANSIRKCRRRVPVLKSSDSRQVRSDAGTARAKAATRHCPSTGLSVAPNGRVSGLPVGIRMQTTT